LKPDLGPKAKFTKWIKICATAGYETTQCAGVAAGTRFCHNRNSNHRDQKIGSKKHKLSLFMNDEIAECYASQGKDTFPRWSYGHERNYLG